MLDAITDTLEQKLEKTDLNNMTPLDALTLLHELQNRRKKEKNGQ